MEIRRKLTYQFIAIVAIILLISSLAIYVSFSKTRKDEFFDRLSSKAKMVAQMLIEVEEVDAELLKKIEKNNPTSLPNERIVVFDYKNKRLYSTDDEKILKISSENISDARMEEEIRLIQKPYEIIGSFYVGQYDRIVVFAGAVDIFGIKKLKRLRIILIIVFISSLIIIYFAGRLFAARALAPVLKIIEDVDNIGVSNLNLRIDEGNGADELARLAKTFNKMLKRLESSFKIQKNFIANASHELRTPLTLITGQLEVVLMQARDNEEYKDTIISVLEDIKNLNHISNRLLLLAQASSDFAEIAFTTVRIDDLIWQARSELLKRKSNYTIKIEFKDSIIEEGLLSVLGNEMLLKTAITNLMDNACKYSDDNQVEINIDTATEIITITFKDNGIGISPEDVKMIFQPFYRGKNVKNIKGHGIGLSVVEKIISLHKGTINIESILEKGSTFTISIPTVEF